MTREAESRRNRARLTRALLAAVVFASCGVLDPGTEAEGRVRFDPIEGGCWLIDSAGVTYDPINLSDEFKVDGLRIRFEADVREDMAHFCPGTIIELKEIEAIS